MITDELLNELEQKEKAATPGPWASTGDAKEWTPGVAWYNVNGASINGPGTKCVVAGGLDGETDEAVGVIHNEDASLIAAARNALPDLLAEVRKLRAENAAIRAAVGPMVEIIIEETEDGVFPLPAGSLHEKIAAQARAAADALEGMLDATA